MIKHFGLFIEFVIYDFMSTLLVTASLVYLIFIFVRVFDLLPSIRT